MDDFAHIVRTPLGWLAVESPTGPGARSQSGLARVVQAATLAN